MSRRLLLIGQRFVVDGDDDDDGAFVQFAPSGRALLLCENEKLNKTVLVDF